MVPRVRISAYDFTREVVKGVTSEAITRSAAQVCPKWERAPAATDALGPAVRKRSVPAICECGLPSAPAQYLDGNGTFGSRCTNRSLN